jgi:hypothetical protein
MSAVKALLPKPAPDMLDVTGSTGVPTAGWPESVLTATFPTFVFPYCATGTPASFKDRAV